MVPANRNQMSLYQDTKAGLKSLIQQTAQVFVGFMIMLLVTGGNPSGLVVGLSFCLGVGFVAWSEKNRLEEINSSLDDDCEPEAPIATVDISEIHLVANNKHYSLSKNYKFHNTNLPIMPRAEQVQLEASKLSEQKRDTFLTQFFPDATQRTIIQSQLALVETEYEFCERALETLRETQLQALTETCNQYLTLDKAAFRDDTAKFLLQKKEELVYELNAIFEQFMKLLKERYQNMKDESNPLFRKIRQDKLEKDISDFVELLNQLIDKFKRLVDEEVNY